MSGRRAGQRRFEAWLDVRFFAELDRALATLGMTRTEWLRDRVLTTIVEAAELRRSPKVDA